MLPPTLTRRTRGGRPLGEAGFTVVEAMIALLLSSLVVGMGYASFTFLSRMVVQWNDRMAVENTVHRLARDITRKAHRANEVRVQQTGGTFVTDDGTTRYRLEDDALERNGQPAHDERVDVVAFSIQVLQPRASLSSDEGESASASSGGEAQRSVMGARRHLHLRIAGATQTDTLSLRTAVYLRQPDTWSGSSGQERILEQDSSPGLSPQRPPTAESPR